MPSYYECPGLPHPLPASFCMLLFLACVIFLQFVLSIIQSGLVRLLQFFVVSAKHFCARFEWQFSIPNLAKSFTRVLVVAPESLETSLMSFLFSLWYLSIPEFILCCPLCTSTIRLRTSFFWQMKCFDKFLDTSVLRVSTIYSLSTIL